MQTITAPEPVQQLLAGVHEKAEIRDLEGKLIGFFTPLAAHEAEVYERAKALFDPVEMERIVATEHGKGRPLADIWADLKAREPVS